MRRFKLSLQIAYYNHGYFNIPIEFDKMIGDHRSHMLVVGYDGSKFDCIIDRDLNKNGSARVIGKAKLKNWIRENFNFRDEATFEITQIDEIHIFKDDK